MRPASDVINVAVDHVDGDAVVIESAVVEAILLVCHVETVRRTCRVRVLYSYRLRRAVYKQCFTDFIYLAN